MMVHRFDRMLVRAVCTALAVCFLAIVGTQPAPGSPDPTRAAESWSSPDDTPLELAASGSRPRDPLPDTPRGPRITPAAAAATRASERPHPRYPATATLSLPLPHRGGPRVPASDDDPPSALDDDRVPA